MLGYPDTGDAVENENKARKELNKPLRKEDANRTEIPQN